MAQYWNNAAHVLENNHDLEFRGKIALVLLEKWGMVVGHVTREDGSARAITDLIPVEQTVARAFDMAELFVIEAERRGLLRQPIKTAEQLSAEIGTLHGLQDGARFEVKATPPRRV